MLTCIMHVQVLHVIRHINTRVCVCLTRVLSTYVVNTCHVTLYVWHGCVYICIYGCGMRDITCFSTCRVCVARVYHVSRHVSCNWV